MKIKSLILVIFTIMAVTVVVLSLNMNLSSKSSQDIVTPSSSIPVNPITNNSTQTSNNTHTTNDSKGFDVQNPQYVNSDHIYNNIRWSYYPQIEKICVHDSGVSEPTEVINHTFIYFDIDVNIKDPENTKELYREMAGVAIEMRQMLGPNSSVNVWGLVNGIDSYHVGMLPYENRVYAIDHYHPFAYKNEIYLIPGADIYDYHTYTIVNNSVIEP